MNTINNDRGIAIIYVTLFLMVLGILFFALGIDIGWMTYVKTQGQAAADASALAGAAAIPAVNSSGSPAKANEMAALFNTNNTVMNQAAGISASDVQVCDGSPSSPVCPASDLSTAGGVKVTKTYNTPLFFTRFLNGVGSTNISVSATAWLGGLAGIRPDLPVVLCGEAVGFDPSAPEGSNCDPAATLTFNPNGTDTAGYWNYPANDNMNASTCKDYVENPSHIPNINVNDIIDTNNGVANSCLKDIDDKYASCTPAKCALAADHPDRKACTAVIPIIDCPNSINKDVPVKGFASLCITAVESQGKNKFIDANLSCFVTAPGIGGGPFFGTYPEKPVLVQ
jgi:hypothetical protein